MRHCGVAKKHEFSFLRLARCACAGPVRQLRRVGGDRLDLCATKLGRLAAPAPHREWAFVLTDGMRASLMHDRRLHEHLDRLRCGMVFCDTKGRVHWLNRSAEHLLADGPLRLVGWRLRGDSEADTDELMSELAGSAAGNTASYLRLGQGKRALHLAIQASTHPATMVLTLTSPARSADIPADALIRLFGLTPTEAGLLAALATGSTLEQYAQDRGVSVGTARVQLKCISAKTGVHRQSDLVRLVWSSAVAHLSAPPT